MITLKREEIIRSNYINYFVKLEFGIKYLFQRIIIFKIKHDKKNIEDKIIEKILFSVFEKHIKIEDLNFDMIWINYFRKKTPYRLILEEFFGDKKIIEKIQNIISMRNRILHRYLFSFKQEDFDKLNDLKNIIERIPMPWESKNMNNIEIECQEKKFKNKMKEIEIITSAVFNW